MLTDAERGTEMKKSALLLMLCLLMAVLPVFGPAEEAETVDINGLKLRQGMTAFSTLKGRQDPRYTSEDVEGPLRQYCPNLLALDLGHNDVSDLTFLKAWPKLRRLIIVDSKTPITDISPLAELDDLEYVELFMQNITDISAFEGKTHLIDLNLAHNDITDLTPLYSCTSLKRLWISYNRHLSKEQIKAFKEVNPECRVVDNEWSSTGRGWRETADGKVPHYAILMESFRSGEYIPFADSAPLEEAVPEEAPASGSAAAGGGGAPEAADPEKTKAGTEAEAASGVSSAPDAAASAEEPDCAMLRNGGSFVYVIQKDGTILGWGEENFTLDANQQCRVMYIDGSSTVANLGGLTILNGNSRYSSLNNYYGGGIYSQRNRVSADNVVISENTANKHGGGVFTQNVGDGGTITFTNSTIINNTSGENGGGIYSNNCDCYQKCTISGNKAKGDGGALFVTYACYQTVLSDSKLVDNTAGNTGGAIRNDGNVRFINCELTGNHADCRGGGYCCELGGKAVGYMEGGSMNGNSAPLGANDYDPQHHFWVTKGGNVNGKAFY